MNTKQRRVLKIVVWVIGLMTLFPPVYHPVFEDRLASHGYELIFSEWGRVDADLLFMQFVAVGIIAYIAYLLYADRND